MEDLKIVFARNLIMLRKQQKLTQSELADKIHYSDKAVSKWERGESIPDVSVLKTIADMFGVTVDFLITEHENAEIAEEQTSYAKKIKKRNRLIINFITIFSMLAVEAIVFGTLQMSGTVKSTLNNFLFCFVCPLPALGLVEIIFSSLWAKKSARFIAVSAFVWSLFIEAFIIVYVATGKLAWYLIAIGLVAQIIVVLSFNLHRLKIIDKK